MTIDTNIIIGYLNGEEQIITTLTHWRKEGLTLFLPTVVEAEVLSFSGWTETEELATTFFLEENFTSISFDRTVARLAARLRRETKIKFPDAAIAATALSTRTPLITRNVRDFKRISGLRVLTI